LIERSAGGSAEDSRALSDIGWERQVELVEVHLEPLPSQRAPRFLEVPARGVVGTPEHQGGGDGQDQDHQ
jgi:hypothetical protein